MAISRVGTPCMLEQCPNVFQDYPEQKGRVIQGPEGPHRGTVISVTPYLFTEALTTFIYQPDV